MGTVSRSGKPGGRALALAEHLRSIGATCDVETVQDRSAGEFGRFHYRSDPATMILHDTLRPIAEVIATRTIAWARSGVGGDGGPGDGIDSRAGVAAGDRA